MNFEELLYRAKLGDQEATDLIFENYRSLLIRYAMVQGRFDEELYHELVIELLKCIQYFRKPE